MKTVFKSLPILLYFFTLPLLASFHNTGTNPEGVLRLSVAGAWNLNKVTHQFSEQGKKEKISKVYNRTLPDKFFGELGNVLPGLRDAGTNTDINLAIDAEYTFNQKIFAASFGVNEKFLLYFLFKSLDYQVTLPYKQAFFQDGKFYNTAMGAGVVDSKNGEWPADCTSAECIRKQNNLRKVGIEKGLQKTLNGLNYENFEDHSGSSSAYGFTFGAKYRFYDETDNPLKSAVLLAIIPTWGSKQKHYANLLDKDVGNNALQISLASYTDYVFNDQFRLNFTWWHDFNFSYTHKNLNPIRIPMIFLSKLQRKTKVSLLMPKLVLATQIL